MIAYTKLVSRVVIHTPVDVIAQAFQMLLISSPTYYLPTPNNKLSTNTNKEASCPSSHTKQYQISCADFGYPIFTNYVHSSPIDTTKHSCQLTASIHSPTLPLHSHIPSAIQMLHSRTESSLKLTSLPRLIYWTAALI